MDASPASAVLELASPSRARASGQRLQQCAAQRRCTGSGHFCPAPNLAVKTRKDLEQQAKSPHPPSPRKPQPPARVATAARRRVREKFRREPKAPESEKRTRGRGATGSRRAAAGLLHSLSTARTVARTRLPNRAARNNLPSGRAHGRSYWDAGLTVPRKTPAPCRPPFKSRPTIRRYRS